MRLCGGSERARVGSRARCEEAAGGCGSREVRVCIRQRRRVRLERDSRLPVWREGVGEDRERGRESEGEDRERGRCAGSRKGE